MSKRLVLLLVALALGFAGLTPVHAQIDGDFSAGGGIKIGTSTTTCDSSAEGGLRYNNTSKCLELCDGSNWGCISVAACADATPAGFDFTDLVNQSTSTQVESNILQITGLGCIVNVAVSGEGTPQYRTCTDGTSDANCDGSVVIDWTSSTGTIENNQYLQVRLTTSAAGGDTFSATLVVGTGADVWNATPAGDCSGSPAAGTVCADGTVYAGQSPDGNVKMYVTRCDAGMSWNGTTCTGTRSLLPWNDGDQNWVATGFTSAITGEANTTSIAPLDSNNVAAGNQPHLAVNQCNDLSQDGHTDWYLPARNELAVIYGNKDTIGHFDTGKSYSTSTENNQSDSFAIQFSNGNEFASSNSKDNNYAVRCTRKD